MSSYGALWSARIQLLRPGNGAMAAVATLVGGVLVTGTTWLQSTSAWAAALAAFLITGFGNILNDLTDRDLDASAHPERPLVTGALTVQQAQSFAAIVLALGIWEAFVAAGIPTLVFALTNTLALVVYERWAKARGLPGNLLVAALVASAFLFGATATGTDWHTWGMVAALAAMAFLTNMARELLKDTQDMEADRGTRRTFPLQAGHNLSVALAFTLVQVAIGLSVLAIFHAPWSRWWVAPLVLADVVFLAAAAMSWMDVRGAQQGLKIGMLLALTAFLLGPML